MNATYKYIQYIYAHSLYDRPFVNTLHSHCRRGCMHCTRSFSLVNPTANTQVGIYRTHNTVQEERAAAIKIQTRARGMSAKKQRARHATRVGSIRDSGRAAADDLRALSRPSTAAEALAGGEISWVLSGPPNARGSSSGRRSRTAGPSKTAFGAGGAEGVLEMAAAIALADIRPPLTTVSDVGQSDEHRSCGSRNSAAAGSSRNSMAGGGLISPSRGRGSAVMEQPRTWRSRSSVSTPDRRYGTARRKNPVLQWLTACWSVCLLFTPSPTTGPERLAPVGNRKNASKYGFMCVFLVASRKAR